MKKDAMTEVSAPWQAAVAAAAERAGAPPKLFRRRCETVGAVECVADGAAWQGWRMTPADAGWRTRELVAGDRLILDFGEELVGTVTLRLEPVGSWSFDAPLRFRLGFGELPAEVALAGSPYRGGLSESWMQEEVFTLDELPCEFSPERRFAFRYVALDVIAFGHCRFRVAEAVATSWSSADERMLQPAPENPDEELRNIDRVGIATLRNCMQRVFEDGPKRDRRLWLGDLQLQARVNAVTYRDFASVERCLRLLAAAADENGLIPGCVFDRGTARRGCDAIDYALLFGPTLLEHRAFSGRDEAVRELFPLACRQLELARPFFDRDGGCDVAAIPWWVFIDHLQGLDRQAAFTGVFIYSLRAHARLAACLGAPERAAAFAAEAESRSRTARALFWRPESGRVVSGPAEQHSYASVIWLALAGVLSGGEIRRAVAAVSADSDAVKPVSPYLWHFWLEVLFANGMAPEAWALIRRYWGGMVRAGADTFWEVYLPDDPTYSPYGDLRLNSACHAWSCTPTAFIRSRRNAAKI